ncbi:MAG: hypothetical protein R3D71_01365 [Rickettsiales bacterium]
MAEKTDNVVSLTERRKEQNKRVESIIKNNDNFNNILEKLAGLLDSDDLKNADNMAETIDILKKQIAGTKLAIHEFIKTAKKSNSPNAEEIISKISGSILLEAGILNEDMDKIGDNPQLHINSITNSLGKLATITRSATESLTTQKYR